MPGVHGQATGVSVCPPNLADMSQEQKRCPVCGEQIGGETDVVRAWPGTYAHSRCATYERRPRARRGRYSHPVYRKFTRT